MSTLQPMARQKRCRVLENDVSVGTAKAEAVDASAARSAVWPRCQFGGYSDVLRQVNIGIELLEPEVLRN